MRNSASLPFHFAPKWKTEVHFKNITYIFYFICLMKIKTRMSSNTIMARRPQETSRLIIEATSTVVDKQNKSA